MLLLRKLWWLIIVIIMVGAMWMLALSLGRVQTTVDDLSTAIAEIDVLRDAVAEANERLAAADEAPVDVPDVVTAEPSEPVTVIHGKDGKDAPRPTAAQISASVTAYCAPLNLCQGDVGAPSVVPGPASTVPGPASTIPGRAPTADEIAAAVADYCADGSCTGPGGADGATGATGPAATDGEDGKAGRGVESTTCRDDGTWLIAYDDGTRETSPGPCRVTPAPPLTEAAP